jgi:hypothetical protein
MRTDDSFSLALDSADRLKRAPNDDDFKTDKGFLGRAVP